jgi:geranylgeranyl diphosphate synthase type I
MCEGQHQDLVFRDRVDITTDSYVRMARDRTGALIGAALELGASAAGCDPATAGALRAFGEEVGVALQIQEDIQMLWGTPISGKPLGTDIMNKKKSYPVVNAQEQAPVAQKRELGTLLFQRVLEPTDVEKVTALLDAQNARTDAQDAAQRILDGAIGLLDGANLNANGRAELEEMARWLAIRPAGP